MSFIYRTKGTCSRQIELSIKDGIIENVQFQGGCDGNLTGLSLLLQGADAKQTMERLRGTRCGQRGTSCPDQLSLAIEQALAEQA